MKTGDLSKQFGVSVTTIQNWTSEFATFLSDDAQGKNAKQRRFDGDDYLVIATVAGLSAEDHTYAEIRDRLANGYRVEDASAATVGYADGRMVPAAAVEQIIDSTQIRVELEQIRSERDRLLLEVDGLKTAMKEYKTETDAANEEVKALLREIAQLEGRAQAAEMEAKMLREQARKRRG